MQLPNANAKYAVLLGAVFIFSSIALQFTDIQTFKTIRIYRWPAILYVVIGTFQTYWLEFVHPDIIFRAISNSLLFSIGYAACTNETIVRDQSKLKYISWFAGVSFFLLSLAMLIRAIHLSQFPPQTFNLYANIPVNPATFVINCLLQLCVNFSFFNA